MGAKIKDFEPGLHVFWCPGCECCHMVDSRWKFNGDYVKPIFSPSLLVTIGHHPDPPDKCHSFITDGRIRFLNDCTHKLAGQTVEIPNWDDELF